MSGAGASGDDRAVIEDLSLALVREYLAKRKYKKTLECLASELPFKPVPTTTTALAKGLGITKFVSKNSKAEHPYPTLLEIFAEYMYGKYGKNETADGTPAAAPSSQPATSRVASKSSSSRRPTDDDEDLSRQLGRSTFSPSSASSSRLTSSSSKSPVSPSSYSSTPLGGPSSRPTSSSSIGSAYGGLTGSSVGGFTSSSGSSVRPGSASRIGRPLSGSSARSSEPELMLEEDVDFEEELSSYDARRGSSNTSSSSAGRGIGVGSSSSSLSAAGAPGSLPFTPPPPSVPLSLDAAHRAKSLIFGSAHLTGTFTDPWLQQGFVFQPSEVTRSVPSLTCGLVQHQGGPCGILAVVQAYLLKELLFGPAAAQVTNPQKRYGLLSPSSPTVLHTALVNALAEILWLVGDQKLVRAVSRNPAAARMGSGPKKMTSGNGVFKPDGVTEGMQVAELTSLASVRNFYAAHLAAIMAPQGAGVVMFLYSVVLTRGIESIESDRDEATSLIGAHSYCTQDMVSLALTGRARSNVFDGQKDLGGLVLRGIDKRSSIGFLTLFEHYDNVLVGAFLKQPQYPIWVVCSESHYTVLFSLDPAMTGAQPSTGVFDLYYYDQLAKQREEIRLTVDTTQRGAPPKDGDLEPPINECIRTKWGKQARIDWNGVEPIL